MNKRIGTIYAPEIPDTIPNSSQWISGQGSGAWFYIGVTEKQNHFNIKRFTPKGSLDCDRVFVIEENGLTFDINQAYKFKHVSHCAKCRIEQAETVFVFNYGGE